MVVRNHGIGRRLEADRVIQITQRTRSMGWRLVFALYRNSGAVEKSAAHFGFSERARLYCSNAASGLFCLW